MVINGNTKGADDYRKYFIRITLKDKTIIEWGHTWSLSKIKDKYQISLAMIKAMILPEVKNNLVKDESIYEDYIYK